MSEVKTTTETVKDLMPETPDLNVERLARLKELFPDLFTDEGNLSEVELKKLVDPHSVNETERYEFRWFGKSNAKRKAFTPTTATLNYDAARSVNPEVSENIIIEGENLKVLKLLLCSYREQIKCIYIDPPYNTGKDFVYSDNYTEDRMPYWKQTGVLNEYGVKVDTNAETDGRFHSNWMNMMFSRLLVARQLLRNDGVIFISIDDNEVHNLRRLCNEVFNEDNFLGLIVRATGTTTGQDATKFGSSSDYCLAYRKSETFSLNGMPLAEKDKQRFNQNDNDGKGKYALLQLRKTGNADRKEDRENMFYPISAPDTNKIYPVASSGYLSRWRVGNKKYKELVKANMIVWKKVDEIESVNEIEEIEDELEQIIGDENGETKEPIIDKEIVVNNTYIPYVKYYLEGRTKKPSTLWTDIEGNKKGSIEIKNLFGVGKIFDNPKPTDFIKRLLLISCQQDDIVLDFFAGAGSTGQAVMELNEANGGNLKFILVQLPELTNEKSEAYKAGYKRISDITIERNKRVVTRLVEEKRAKHPNLFKDEGGEDALKGLGFKVFQLEKSYFPRTEWSPDANVSEAENVASLKQYIAQKESQLHIDFDRDKLLTEILLKEGFKLNYITAPYAAVTSNHILHVSDADREAMICLDPTLDNATVEHFKTHTEQKFICLERALDTTQKWNLNNYLGEKFKPF